MIRSKLFWGLMLAGAVFATGVAQGMAMALKKPLWNDEIYSQMASVEKTSWQAIWSGGIREGNNSPLFYSAQKLLANAVGYKSDDLWHKDDIQARALLRVFPVLCMALGLAVLVGFFVIQDSLFAAALAFLTAISSYMVWYFWAEARPYAMIFLWSVCQSVAMVAFLCRRSGRSLGSLAASHYLIALTSSLSVIQIAAAGAILWVAGERRWRVLLPACGIPFLIAGAYYSQAPHYKFYFASHGMPLNLIMANIPSGRLLAILLVPVVLWIIAGPAGRAGLRAVLFVWGWLLLVLAGYGLFLMWLMQQQGPNHEGFEISNRYLMALTPVGIIAFTVFSLALIRHFKARWAQGMALILIGVLLLPRVAKAWGWMVTGLGAGN